MNPICFYHKADLDGVCSAAIVKHFVPDCDLYGIDYGEEFPWDLVTPKVKAVYPLVESTVGTPCENPEWVEAAGRCLVVDDLGARVEIPSMMDARLPRFSAKDLEKRTVYMVDFSLPVEDMKRLAEVSNLIWIDHHKTAIDAVGAAQPMPFFQGLGDATHAACELTWWYLAGGRGSRWTRFAIEHEPGSLPALPEAIRLLGVYDSWRKDDPEWETKVLPFQYGARALKGVYDPLSDWWVNVLKSSPTFLEFVTDAGKAVLSFQAEQNRQACQRGAHEAVLFLPHGPNRPSPDPAVSLAWRLLACNTTMNTSQFFEGFYDPEKHDVMCAYRQMKDGSWKVSLYSTKPEIDCGAIAKAFGGGGHRGAAGFECDKLPWSAV